MFPDASRIPKELLLEVVAALKNVEGGQFKMRVAAKPGLFGFTHNEVILWHVV